MENLVGPAYFIANRTVAQLSQNSVKIDLETFIKRLQYDYLVRVMGLPLYKLFETEYAQDPKPAKWVELVTGGEFEYKGSIAVWGGLANDTFKTSPIADYVYYFYHRDKATEVVGSGTIIPDTENGANVVNRSRMVDAWNSACKNAQLMELFLESDPVAYPDYKGVSAANREYFRNINLMNL